MYIDGDAMILREKKLEQYFNAQLRVTNQFHSPRDKGQIKKK